MQKLSFSIQRKGLILVAVPLLFAILYLAVLSHLLNQAEHEINEQTQAKEIISTAHAVTSSFGNLENAMTGYLLTRSQIFLDRFDRSVTDVKKVQAQLRQLAEDSPDQKSELENLKQQTEDCLSVVQQLQSNDRKTSDGKDGPDWRRLQSFKQLQALTSAIDRQSDRVADLALKRSEAAKHGPDAKKIITSWLWIGLLLNAATAIGMALFFSKSISDRLATLTRNSASLAMGQALAPLVGGSDEIASLDEAFHSMAEMVDEAGKRERALADNVKDLICVINEKHKIIRINSIARKIFSTDPMSLLGMHLTRLLGPENYDLAARSLEIAKNSQQAETFECCIAASSTIKIDLLWSAYYSTREKWFYLVGHDISQRKLVEQETKASEARLRLILESMPVGLILLTREGLIELINPTVERMFLTSASSLLHHGPEVLFKNDYLKTAMNGQISASNLLAEFCDPVNKDRVWKAKRSNGQDLYVEVSIAQVEKAVGSRWLMSLLDITDRMEIMTMKRELVSIVTHELRTPLTTVMGFLQLLETGIYGDLNSKGNDRAVKANRNAGRLMRLINNLLDLEKLESGMSPLVRTSVRLQELQDDAIAAVQEMADKSDIYVHLSTNDAVVSVDAEKMTRLLINFLSNAIKYSPPKSTICIDFRINGTILEVRVSDNGLGIGERDQARVFERFQQVQSADGKSKGGTGLGLAICKAIAQQHGGFIGVDSHLGSGSSFWIRIPI